MAKLLLISDTHGHFGFPACKEQIERMYAEDVDAIICMGDVYEAELTLAKTIADGKGVPIFGIPGNHEPKTAVSEHGIENIHGKVVEICGVKIAGIGGCSRYKDDNARLFLTEKESVDLASAMEPADILITHSPTVKGFEHKDPVHRGLLGVDKYISLYSPAYHFYGHVHERGTGKYVVKKGLFKRAVTKQCGIYRAAIFDTGTGELKYLL